MAYFAKLDDNNIVIGVYAVHNDELKMNGSESEERGIAFMTAWSGGHTNWKQCSYNGNKRKRYPGVGYRYDETDDVFIAPQPFPSWSLNNKHEWEPPGKQPNNGSLRWDENALQWVEP